MATTATATTTPSVDANTAPVPTNVSSARPGTETWCNVYLARLPIHTFKDDDLERLVTPFGKIISARIMRQKGSGLSKGYAFILFAEARSALRCVETLNGKRLDAGHILECRLAHQEASNPDKMTTIAPDDKDTLAPTSHYQTRRPAPPQPHQQQHQQQHHHHHHQQQQQQQQHVQLLHQPQPHMIQAAQFPAHFVPQQQFVYVAGYPGQHMQMVAVAPQQPQHQQPGFAMAPPQFVNVDHASLNAPVGVAPQQLPAGQWVVPAPGAAPQFVAFAPQPQPVFMPQFAAVAPQQPQHQHIPGAGAAPMQIVYAQPPGVPPQQVLQFQPQGPHGGAQQPIAVSVPLTHSGPLPVAGAADAGSPATGSRVPSAAGSRRRDSYASSDNSGANDDVATGSPASAALVPSPPTGQHSPGSASLLAAPSQSASQGAFMIVPEPLHNVSPTAGYLAGGAPH